MKEKLKYMYQIHSINKSEKWLEKILLKLNLKKYPKGYNDSKLLEDLRTDYLDKDFFIEKKKLNFEINKKKSFNNLAIYILLLTFFFNILFVYTGILKDNYRDGMNSIESYAWNNLKLNDIEDAEEYRSKTNEIINVMNESRNKGVDLFIKVSSVIGLISLLMVLLFAFHYYIDNYNKNRYISYFQLCVDIMDEFENKETDDIKKFHITIENKLSNK